MPSGTILKPYVNPLDLPLISKVPNKIWFDGWPTVHENA
jgi:hypothetical protein